MSDANGSHLAWIRARHAELQAERLVDKPVPGYGGRLVLRCAPVPWATVVRMQNQSFTDRDGKGLLHANADVIIAACRDVLVDGAPIADDGPTRIGPELADLLGADTTTARETLLWLYPSELAVGVAAGELLEWTRDADADVAEELVGE